MSEFKSRALRLKDRGYQIVPIHKGQKGPVELSWQNKHYTDEEIGRLAANGYADGNIGINTRNTPAIDIDVYDEVVALEMQEWVLQTLGDACVRVGRAPKRLIVFRTDEPFRKLWVTYSDGNRDHKLEILGSGQQFVAYGIHPDTRKPYDWISFDEPMNVSAAKLPSLSYDQARDAITRFSEICEAHGWTRVSGSFGGKVQDNDDDFSAYKKPLSITEETILETLEFIPNDDADYDSWMEVGFALHHQYGGLQRGLELWHEWGERSAKYDAHLTNYKYGSMGHGPDTATFATLIYKAKLAREKAEDLAFAKALNRVSSTNDSKRLLNEIMKELAVASLNDIQSDLAIRTVQNRVGELEGSKPRLESVRKAFDKFRPKNTRKLDLPKWCENWYFVESENGFYHSETGAFIGRQAFDAKYGRMLLSDDMREQGESFAGKASDTALNLFQIPTVYSRVYWPGYDQVINIDGLDCVNTFNNSLTPPAHEASNPFEFDSVQKVKEHFELLFPDERERNLFIDYLAYTVQFPKEKITWGVLVQGVDGGGKSWFSRLMAAVLGGVNVRPVDGSTLKDNFTGWAQGYRMVFIEEVRVSGHNRFEILDKLKPYLTNETVPVRKMRTDSFSIRNVTNYVLFTNYTDALPLSRADRRYFVIRTCFQTKSHIRKFMDENPSYFTDLFNIVDFDGPVLRHWLMNRPLSDEFQAKGYAPDTDAKEFMREESEDSDELDDLENIIATSNDPFLSDAVLSLARLRRGEMSRLNSLPRRTLGVLLARAGFAYVGKYRLGFDGDKEERIYTRHSELFDKGDKRSTIVRLTKQDKVDDGFNNDGFD